jgi:hypothetical protein
MSRGRMVNSVFPSDKCLTRRRPRTFGSSQESRVPQCMRMRSCNEIRQLYNVSDRLDALAEQHPLVSDALIGISGSVRNTATLLEVVVALKMPLLAGLDPASA